MLERLETAFRAERALVEDVSHELRNPVGVINAHATSGRPARGFEAPRTSG